MVSIDFHLNDFIPLPDVSKDYPKSLGQRITIDEPK